jgi:hypothetical protein
MKRPGGSRITFRIRRIEDNTVQFTILWPGLPGDRGSPYLVDSTNQDPERYNTAKQPPHLREQEVTEITLESLGQRVDALEQRLAAGVPPESSVSSLSAWMSDVKQITEELFPGPFSCSDESDPEYPDNTYVVVSVESTGDMRDVVRRRCAWHERIRALSPDLFGKFRLSISPR